MAIKVAQGQRVHGRELQRIAGAENGQVHQFQPQGFQGQQAETSNERANAQGVHNQRAPVAITRNGQRSQPLDEHAGTRNRQHHHSGHGWRIAQLDLQQQGYQKRHTTASKA